MQKIEEKNIAKIRKTWKKAKELVQLNLFRKKILMGRLIKQINFPDDLRKFKKDDLRQISNELRDELIDVVSETGGT